MNAETGQIERVMGATADGFNVFESYGLKLKFTLLCWERTKTTSVFSMWIEFQKNERGKQRPNLGLALGAVLFQSGWLFA